MLGHDRIAFESLLSYLLLLNFLADRSLASVGTGQEFARIVQPPRAQSSDVYKKEFETFKERFNKHYESSEDEKIHFEAFKANYDLIETHRSKNASYSLEINALSDLTQEEFARLHQSYKKLDDSENYTMLGEHQYSGDDLPSSVDWRDFGAASHVKDQKNCGGCWAFSSNAAVEGAWYIATNKKQSLSLSDQQIIDCTPFPAEQCSGGNPAYAFAYMQEHAVCTVASYAFASNQGQRHSCQTSCTEAIPQGGVIGARSVPSGNAQTLMEAVSQQPVAVAIKASRALSSYHSGVFDNCGTSLDHSVLLVGYGTEDGKDYWLIQNSWGESWGQGGFGKLLRSADDVCGVLSEAIYPVVDGSKALASMNPQPLALTLAWVFGGIALTLALIAIALWGFKGFKCCKCCKSRNRTALVVRGVPAASMQQVNEAAAPLEANRNRIDVAASPYENSGQKGNSNQSRLLK